MKSIQQSLLILGLLLVLLAAACVPAPNVSAAPVSPSPTPLPLPNAAPTEAQAAASASGSVEMPATSADLTGASLYQLSCAACHGQDRAGNKFEVDEQTIEVPALAWDDLNKMYTTDPSRGSVPDQLALAITKGLDEEGGDLPAMMPRWSSLTQGQVDSLVQYIQTADTANGAASLSSAATNLMGEQLYLTSCAACHGVDGAGKTFEVDGNTIKPPTLSWSELNDMYSTDPSRGSVADQVALAITKGLDEEGGDLPSMMPRWSFLSQEQVDSLVQYLQTTFK